MAEPIKQELVDIETINEYGMVSKANYNGGMRTFNDYDGNVSVRSDYNRSDYDFFRPSESLPKDAKGTIALCMMAYESVGIVKNVIDLMGDFTCQGIRIVHKNKSIERFLNRWWHEVVKGTERSNAFCNLLYRGGQVPVYRTDGKITGAKHKQLKSAKGDIEEDAFEKRVIPVSYTFFDPIAVEVIGGNLAAFVGKPEYRIKIMRSMRDDIINVGSNAPQYREYLPAAIQHALSTTGYLDIDQDRFSMHHYKKDDWRIWSMPVIQPILKDLMHLEKLRLADSAALDGVISSVRLWILGDIEHNIIPNKAMLAMLKNALANNASGRVLDLVWGPGIDFKESTSQAYKFLGPEKYVSTLNAVYSGLGIPPTLTGTSDASGFTNNYIAIKTLIERLNYGRHIVTAFWNKELKRLQKAMGHVSPGVVVFDNDVLADEQVYRTFLIELIDREYLSMESLHERIKIPHEVEKSRLAKEQKDRYSGRLPDKSSPYHNPHIDDDLRKIILTGGGIAPSEVGIELLPRKPGEKTVNEMKMEGMPSLFGNKQDKEKPINPNGRPFGQKDKKKRKQRQGYIRTGAFTDILVWATEAQKAIADIVTPAVLAHYNKSNCRKLSNQESEQLESLKFKVLCSFSPYSTISGENVYSILSSTPDIDSNLIITSREFATAFIDRNKREPNVEERKQIQASAYAFFQSCQLNLEEEDE